jgi:hypothetical protein
MRKFEERDLRYDTYVPIRLSLFEGYRGISLCTPQSNTESTKNQPLKNRKG